VIGVAAVVNSSVKMITLQSRSLSIFLNMSADLHRRRKRFTVEAEKFDTAAAGWTVPRRRFWRVGRLENAFAFPHESSHR
jgi:hypothetical protein